MSKGLTRRNQNAKGNTGGTVVGGSGTVTQVSSGTGLTGGPITTSGTLDVDVSANFSWTGLHDFTQFPIVPGVPSTGNELVNKAYVDAIGAGLTPIRAVDVATTANIALTGEQTIDGVLTSGSRILVKNQTAQEENGIYVTAAGAWTRSTDYDTDAEVERGTYTFVIGGTVNTGTQWVQVTASPTLNTDPLVFSPMTNPAVYTASLGVEKVGLDFRADLLSGGGLGLTGNELKVNVDNSTITIVGGNLQANYATSIPISNCLFVAKNGNNATAAVGDLSKPYLTINGAKAAASSGHTIVVFPGTYTETAAIVLSNGINFYFIGTGTVAVSAGSTVLQAVTSATNTIVAPGWTFQDTASRPILTTNGLSGVTLNFTFKQLLSTNEPCLYLNSSTSNMFFKGDYMYTTTGYAVVYGDTTLNGSNTYIDVQKIRIDSADRCIDLQKGNFFLRCQEMQATSGAGIYVQASNAGCRMAFNIDRMNCGGGFWPVWLAGASTHMTYTGLELIGASDCLFVADDGATVYASIQSIHSNYNGTQDGIIHAEGSTLYMSNATITRAGTAVDGGDIKTSGASPQLFLKNVTYDITKTKVANFGEAKTWTSAGWLNCPNALNQPVSSTNAITDSFIPGANIDFDSHDQCTIDRLEMINPEITFTSDGQILRGGKFYFTASQTGTNAPTFDWYGPNSTGVDWTWGPYTTPGQYKLVASAAILNDGPGGENPNVFVTCSANTPGFVGVGLYTDWGISLTDTLFINTYGGGAPGDDLMTKQTFCVEILPVPAS